MTLGIGPRYRVLITIAELMTLPTVPDESTVPVPDTSMFCHAHLSTSVQGFWAGGNSAAFVYYPNWNT